MADERARGREPEPAEMQPDPPLREGRVRPWWAWAFALAVAAVIILVFYGITTSDTGKQGLAVPAADPAPVASLR